MTNHSSGGRLVKSSVKIPKIAKALPGPGVKPRQLWPNQRAYQTVQLCTLLIPSSLEPNRSPPLGGSLSSLQNRLQTRQGYLLALVGEGEGHGAAPEVCSGPALLPLDSGGEEHGDGEGTGGGCPGRRGS